MRPSIFSYPLTLGLLFSTGILMAQVKKDSKLPVEKPKQEKSAKPEQAKGEITEEVEVVRAYKPILADAVKIRKNPDLTNNPTFKPVLVYTILDKKLSLDTSIAPLQAQKFITPKKTVPSNNYLKLGMGNFNTSQGELYLNNGSDEALQVGLSAKHLAQKGDLEKQQFSHQEISVFGHSIGTRTLLSGRVGYDRKQFYFYGFDPLVTTQPINPDQQRFGVLEANADFSNHFRDGNQLSYKLQADAYLFNNVINAKEQNFKLSAAMYQVLDKFKFGFTASIDLTNSKDLSYSLNNNITKVNPSVSFKASNFVLNVGLNIVHEHATKNRLNILPAVDVNIPLASKFASIFGGIQGDVTKNTLRSLSNENPFISQNASLSNTTEQLHIYGGIKGNLGHIFGFKAVAFYKQIENMALFQNNSTLVNRFDVIYDPGKSTHLGLNGELEFKASDIFTLGGNAQINSYQMANEAEAWLKPNFCLGSTMKAKISRKFNIDAAITFNNQTNAKVINPLTFQPITVKVSSFTDISAGAEFQIIKHARLYIRANNLLNKSYQQYLFYPKLGFNIFGGFNFSF